MPRRQSPKARTEQHLFLVRVFFGFAPLRETLLLFQEFFHSFHRPGTSQIVAVDNFPEKSRPRRRHPPQPITTHDLPRPRWSEPVSRVIAGSHAVWRQIPLPCQPIADGVGGTTCRASAPLGNRDRIRFPLGSIQIPDVRAVAIAAHTANHAALAGMCRLKSTKLWTSRPQQPMAAPT